MKSKSVVSHVLPSTGSDEMDQDLNSAVGLDRSSRRPGRSVSPAASQSRRGRSATPHPVSQSTKAALTPEERAYLSENNGCFYCRKTNAGHLARNCPQKAQ